MEFEKIYIASDHGGFHLKQQILEHFTEIVSEDFGTNNPETPVDYPDYAQKVSKSISEFQGNSCGILICKSGVGMSIASNKSRGIRALLCSGDTDIARFSRAHNDCNVICFGADFISYKQAMECLDIFLNTKFLGGRHQVRLDKLL
ncbi:MAG: RpiB/LacA/LacB family sugar-phosphate isomerase [Holosporales bacterium]|nr:RpiB/LacA/LacB family sugar-phosphate isomerase [Holosporales bacterium]